eukprot:363952-Chlamydomonas_euryale.AAC.6
MPEHSRCPPPCHLTCPCMHARMYNPLPSPNKKEHDAMHAEHLLVCSLVFPNLHSRGWPAERFSHRARDGSRAARSAHASQHMRGAQDVMEPEDVHGAGNLGR